MINLLKQVLRKNEIYDSDEMYLSIFIKYSIGDYKRPTLDDYQICHKLFELGFLVKKSTPIWWNDSFCGYNHEFKCI